MKRLTASLPELRVLVVSGMVSTLAAGLLNPVFPVYLQSKGLPLSEIGLVFTLGSLLPVLLQPVLGAASDRFNRRSFVIAVSLSVSLMIPLFAILEQAWLLALMLAMKILLERSAMPVSAAMVADFAPADRRATVFALLDASINLVFVLALVTSAAVVGWLNVSGTLLASGGLFLLGSLVLFRLPASGPQPRGPAQPTRKAWLEALTSAMAPWKLLHSTPSFGPLLAYQLCFSFALDLYPIYLPLYARKLGASEAMVGPIIASSWLAYALVQPTGGRWSDSRPSRKGLILMGLLGMALCNGLLGGAQWLPSSTGLWVMLVAWVAIAIPDGLFRPSAQALVVDVAPEARRGEVLGALGAGAALANVVAPLTYGLVADRFGLGAAFLLSSLALCGAFVAILRVREPARGTLSNPLHHTGEATA